jgi:tetratricopeptide (TPR) repeat protein
MLAALLLCAASRGVAQPPPPLNIVHPLPPQAPPWVEGYHLRWPVRVVGQLGKQPAAQTVLVALPAGGWLRPDASDLAVQAGTGELLPAAVLSHDPAGETILQFKRHGNDPWYWVYGVSPEGKSGPKADPKKDAAFREGVTLEVREWAGTDVGSWAKVREGLSKSDQILGNAIVGEVFQNCDPARPDDPKNFAASYRGFLNIKKDGVYRFLLNLDGAGFLFIDGFKVLERPGTDNRPFHGQVKLKDLEKYTGKVELKAGVHPFEVHYVATDRPQTQGVCVLVWATPEQPKFAPLLQTAINNPLYARVAALERAEGKSAACFAHGLDELLESGGLKLYLMRFEAQGPFPDDAKLQWDFGDGSKGSGRSVVHAYFKEGDYTVSLACGGDLPAYRRKIRVWPEPVENSPLSLDLAVKSLAGMEWQKFEPARLRQIFAFLQNCRRPAAWPLLDAVARHLLKEKDLDLDTRSQLYVSRLEALTRTSKAAEALKLAEGVKGEFARTPALQVRLQLGVAAIHQYHFKDAAAASKIYKAILDEHRRTEHPNLRLAAVRWGDLFAESGDLARASETYRVAATLGGDKLAGGTVTEASTRGALMRIAEQKLRGGEIGQTRQLLERLELEHPGRRIDGLYCFLRAETGRLSGRYEEALRHYEMIFKLPQWAGYRDRAAFGIADTYRRMGELKKAKKWLGDLKDSSPKFYEAQKAEAVAKLIDERLRRLKGDGKGAAAPELFKGFATGWEPGEAEWFGELGNLAAVRAPGIDGPHVLLLDVYPQPSTNLEYNRVLKNVTPGGTYLVELWYRDVFRPLPPPGHDTHVSVYLFGETKEKPQVLAQQMVQRNAHHQWHKLTFRLKAPPAQDCLLKISFMNMSGLMLIDRLRVRPLSDRDLDALVNFQEGNRAP